MKRNFPNFLDAYIRYAHDNFCPDQFHLWTGLSMIAGALERKVWVRQGLVDHRPNIYVLLISHPGSGKTTAIARGADIIERFRSQHNPEFKIIPQQTTEAALVDLMRIVSAIQLGSRVYQYSSGYFYASEASSSALKNEHGDFNATLTEFYDCPPVFRKKLKGDSQTTEILNISFNVLAGTTFEFLKRLVNEESVLGGLASRFIYVISKERKVVESSWHKEQQIDEKTRNALVDDLAAINKLSGPFSPTQEFINCWKKWKFKFDHEMSVMDSARRESLLTRKPTNLIKVCMLLSIAEGNSLVLNESHWERGLSLMDEATRDNSFVLSSAVTANVDKQAAINQIILQALHKRGGKMKNTELRGVMIKYGVDASRVDTTLDSLSEAGQIKLAGGGFELLVDPDTNL